MPEWPRPKSAAGHAPPRGACGETSSVWPNSGRPASRRRRLSRLIPLPRPEPSSRTTARSAGSRANSRAHVTPSRVPAIRPVIQQRLSGSTTISAGLGPKNLVGGGLLDPGPGRLVEDLEQGPGVPTGLVGRPSQRRHARHRPRSRHDLQEPAGDAEADPLGLSNRGELVLRVAGDLEGPAPTARGGTDSRPPGRPGVVCHSSTRAWAAVPSTASTTLSASR